jgi:hypothetical protein
MVIASKMNVAKSARLLFVAMNAMAQPIPDAPARFLAILKFDLFGR